MNGYIVRSFNILAETSFCFSGPIAVIKFQRESPQLGVKYKGWENLVNIAIYLGKERETDVATMEH